jgi:hypothetical protein
MYLQDYFIQELVAIFSFRQHHHHLCIHRKKVDMYNDIIISCLTSSSSIPLMFGPMPSPLTISNNCYIIQTSMKR